MRILQIMPRLPFPPTDGHAVSASVALKGALDVGLQIHLMAFSTPKHPAKTQFFPVWFDRVEKFYFPRILTGINPANVLLGLLPRRSLNIERFNKIKVHWRLDHILRQERFDLIWIDGLYAAPYLPTIRKRTSAPVIMRAHNVEFQIWRRLAKAEKNPLKKTAFRFLARKLREYEIAVANQMDVLLTVTDVDRQTFRRLGVKVPIHVMPVGLDMAQYSLVEAAPDPDTVFLIGALDWKPNVQAVAWFVRRVWPYVKEMHPRARCVIAGKRMPEGFLAPLPAGVEAVGEVPDAHVFMRAHHVMAVPLLAGSGFRVKILEGMALGKPIVSTTVGAEGIEVTPGQDILIADDPEGFARHVATLMKDPHRAQKIGAAARHTVERRYDIRRIYRDLFGFLREQFPALPYDTLAL